MNVRQHLMALLVTLAVFTGGRAADTPAKPPAAAPFPPVRAASPAPATDFAAFTGGRAADTPAKPPAAAPFPPVRATSPAPVTGLAAFRIIEERNIFNPNRVGRTVAGADTPAPQNETIAFVGTMHYEKGLFAFFASSTASFQKTLHEGEQIAQYTLGPITKDSVELNRDGQKLTLTIGQALQRPPGGDWTVTTPVAILAAAPDAARTADQPASPSPAVPADASETLKRLMEKRQQQLKP